MENYGRSRGSQRSQSRLRKSVNFEDLGQKTDRITTVTVVSPAATFTDKDLFAHTSENKPEGLDIQTDNMESDESPEPRGRGRPRKIISFKEYSRESSRDVSSSNERESDDGRKAKRGRKKKDKKTSSDKQKGMKRSSTNHGSSAEATDSKTSSGKKQKVSSSEDKKTKIKKASKDSKDSVPTVSIPEINDSSTPLQSTDKTAEIEYINGGRVQVLDMRDNNWYQCKIVDVNWGAQCVLVHYNRWSSRFDEWINMNSYRIQPPHISQAELEMKRQPTSAGEKVVNENSKLSNGPVDGSSSSSGSDKAMSETTLKQDGDASSTGTSGGTQETGDSSSPKVAGAAKRKKKPSIKRNPGSPDKQIPGLNDSMSESEDSSKVTSVSDKSKHQKKISDNQQSEPEDQQQILGDQQQTSEKQPSVEETTSDPVYSEEISETVADILSRLDAEDTTDSLATVQAIAEADHANSEVSSVSTDDILHGQDDSGHSSDHAVSELISPTVSSVKSSLDISDIVTTETIDTGKSSVIKEIITAKSDITVQKNIDKVTKEGVSEGNSSDKKNKMIVQNQDNVKEATDLSVIKK